MVQASPYAANLRRPRQRGSGGQVPRAKPVGNTRHRGQWARQGPGELVGNGHAEREQSEPDAPSSSQARVTPRRSWDSGTNVRMTAVPAGKPSTAIRISTPVGMATVMLRPLAASRMALDRGAVTPSSRRPGRKTVMGVLAFS